MYNRLLLMNNIHTLDNLTEQASTHGDNEPILSPGADVPAILIFSVNPIFNQNKKNMSSTHILTSDFKQRLIRNRNRFHL